LGKPIFDWVSQNRKRVVKVEKIFPKGFSNAGVLLDKEGGLSAPTESFNPVGTGASKEIENASFRNEGAEGGENCGSNSVLGGSQTWNRWDSQAAASVDSCRDSEKPAPSARLTRGFFFPMTFRWLLLHTASYASF
jgi:hypothetical protein